MSDKTSEYHMRDEDVPGEDATDDVVELGHFSNPDIKFSDYVANGKGLRSFAHLTDDGRITLNLDLRKSLPELPKDYARDVKEFAAEPESATTRGPPKLNVLILIVGSRGDVQPYVALGKCLKENGHRVRIGTHPTFDSFVRDAGLEFYSIGGDPQELMSYMVRNPGLIPGFASLTNGDIGQKRKMLDEMINGCWKAAINPDEENGDAFACDAIISNPPAFAHVHIAERLGVPLHLSFTMPWSPTTAFPHPLVNIKSSNANADLTNYLSYGFAELLTWQGMGDIVNQFRTKSLDLPPLSLRSGSGIVDRLKIPWTYCFSPALVPKPDDWRNHIDVVGFYWLDQTQTSGYTPPPDLADFLDRGSPPIYIGFGSVVIDDPDKMTDIILSAVKKAGVRALLSAGWAGLGAKGVPDEVFIVKDVPHDWLFTKVSAVIHHGGAGTTAIGLKLGKPTLVVPFFGDQLFWGAMIAEAGAGPRPIPHKQLDEDNLAEAITYCRSTRAQRTAQEMGRKMNAEGGAVAGMKSFHRHLPVLNMRCDLDSSRVAVWYWNKQLLRLSAFAAQTLVDAGKLDLSSLTLHRSKEYETRKLPTDPITGGVTEVLRTVTHYYAGIAQIFYNPIQGIINTTVAIPKGVLDIVGSVHDGFVNLPKLYGSETREPGKVRTFQEGLKEGGKGFFYGYYDGIKGLVADPVKGAQKEGFFGAIKGSARSFANVALRPAAGGLGLVVLPARGLMASLTNKFSTIDKLPIRFEARKEEGIAAFKRSSKEERVAVLHAFEKLSTKASLEERKSRLGKEAVEALLEEPELEVSRGEVGGEVEKPSTSTTTPGSSSSSGAQLQPGEGAVDPRAEFDEAAFERDMEMAKRISEAEHAAYERGKADAAAAQMRT